MEDVVHRRLSAGRVEQAGAHPDEAARRHGELRAGERALRLHLQQLGPAGAEDLDHLADRLARRVDRQILDRFVLLAVDVLEQHLRFGDGELVAFAAHGLEQEPQVHHAAA